MLVSSSTEPRRLRQVGRQASVPSASITRATVLLTVACCCGVMLCLPRSALASCSAGIRILSQ